MILLYHRACKIPINLWLVFCAKKGSQLGALGAHGPADFQLGVQLVDVLLDGSLREVERFGDLLVGAALGHQPGKGQLFLGQRGGNGRAVCRAVELGADIAIVGGALTGAADVRAQALAFRQAMDRG